MKEISKYLLFALFIGLISVIIGWNIAYAIYNKNNYKYDPDVSIEMDEDGYTYVLIDGE